jgi:hypothetical protein
MCAVRRQHNADARVTSALTASKNSPPCAQHVARMSAAKSGMFRVEDPGYRFAHPGYGLLHSFDNCMITPAFDEWRFARWGNFSGFWRPQPTPCLAV